VSICNLRFPFEELIMNRTETLECLRDLDARFAAARPRIPTSERAVFDQRHKRLPNLTEQVEAWDPDFDGEEEAYLQPIHLSMRRLEASLPAGGDEALTLTLFATPERITAGQVQWDGERWTVNAGKEPVATRDLHLVHLHLKGLRVQTNDLDLWRASVMPHDLGGSASGELDLELSGS